MHFETGKNCDRRSAFAYPRYLGVLKTELGTASRDDLKGIIVKTNLTINQTKRNIMKILAKSKKGVFGRYQSLQSTKPNLKF